MKSFITSLVIAAFIIAGSIAYGMHIDKISSELLTINTRLTDEVEADDFAGARETAEAPPPSRPLFPAPRAL